MTLTVEKRVLKEQLEQLLAEFEAKHQLEISSVWLEHVGVGPATQVKVALVYRGPCGP